MKEYREGHKDMDELKNQFEKDYQDFKTHIHTTLQPEMKKIYQPLDWNMICILLFIIMGLGWVSFAFFDGKELLKNVGLPCVFVIVFLLFKSSKMGKDITDFSWQKITEYLGLQLVKDDIHFPEGMHLAWRVGLCEVSNHQSYRMIGKQNGVTVQIVRFFVPLQNSEKSPKEKAGFLVMMDMEKNYPGTTLLVSDSLSAKWKGSFAGLQRVKLEWLAFEEKFDLFCDQERAVRKIFTPDVMTAIYDFAEKFAPVSDSFFAFSEGKICFCCETLSSSLSIFENTAEKEWEELFVSLWFLSHLPAFLHYKLVAKEQK